MDSIFREVLKWIDFDHMYILAGQLQLSDQVRHLLYCHLIGFLFELGIVY